MSRFDILREDYENEKIKLENMKVMGASERDLFIQDCLVNNLYKSLVKEAIKGDKRYAKTLQR